MTTLFFPPTPFPRGWMKFSVSRQTVWNAITNQIKLTRSKGQVHSLRSQPLGENDFKTRLIYTDFDFDNYLCFIQSYRNTG